MTVTCSAPLNATELFGIPATGRCSECQRAYCLTHLGPEGYRGYRCGRCLRDDADRVEETERLRQHRIEEAQERIAQIAARLRRAVPGQGLRSRTIKTGERKTLFRGYVPEIETLPSAWPVGKQLWTVIHGSKDGET